MLKLAEATLTIDSTNVDSIIVLSQDVVENGSYDPTSWEIASETLSSASSSAFTWSEALPLNETDAATFRFWTVVDATKDSDKDGLPDGVEQLVTHTLPNLADSDYDGTNDYDEFDVGTNPNKNDIAYLQLFSQGTKGSIRAEYWFNVSGSRVSNLIGSSSYSNVADQTETLDSFEIPSNRYQNYGTRVRGYIHPPITGEYTFWLSSDDYGELWLAKDTTAANKEIIANVNGYTGSRQWDKYASQESIAITLEAGQSYYIEALMKESGGGDNLAVAWRGPGIEQSVIDGSYLSPFIDNTPLISPKSGVFQEAQLVTITTPNPNFEVRYTIDFSAPTVNSTLYTAPFTLNTTATVKAQAFFKGEIVSGFETQTIIIDPTISNLEHGLSTTYFNGTWEDVPNLDFYTHFKTGVVNQIDFRSIGSAMIEAGKNKELGIEFTGYIYLPESTIYNFYASGNDGVKVEIDGVKRNSSGIFLEQGLHAIN